MKQQIAGYLDYAITLLLLVIAGVTPILFVNQTTDFYDIPKLAFLVVATSILLGLWIFSWIIKGKVSIIRTPLDIPLLALLVVVLVSTFFSQSRYPAIYGNFPRVHGSAISWITYIVLYFVTASLLKSLGRIKALLYTLYGSGVVVAVISLQAFFGIYLPFDFARAVNFTLTGYTFSTVAFLVMLLPWPILSIAREDKDLPSPYAVVLTLLFGITIALIGSVTGYVCLGITFALCLWAVRSQISESLSMLAIPLVITILVAVSANIPLPGNKLQQIVANFPNEVQLPLGISWKITASAFRDAPLIGTGPATYLFNFTGYKPAEFNLQNYWNFSFDTAYNEFLQILGTLGVLGLAAFTGVILMVLKLVRRSLDGADLMSAALAISGCLAIFLFFIHATTLVSMVVTLFIFAALVMSQTAIREKVTDLSFGLKAMTSANNQFDLFPVVIFALYLVVFTPVFYLTYKTVAADYYHRKALAYANTNATLTYQNLQKAETLNPYIDLYRVDLAQINFGLANAIAAQKGPSQASPAGSLTDQDRKTIQTLLSQAITEARVSVALSPLSSRNWETLASIYRNITGVAQNSITFSLDAYGRAIARDPLNPTLRLNAGGVYYSIKNYELATRFFTDAVNLKPDYANAYYNLAIALRDKGDLQNARLVAEQTVTLLQKNTKYLNDPNYKTAADLLEDLKAKTGGKNTAQPGLTPPAASGDSALGNPKLPDINVSDLNNLPQVATPAAVENNPNAVLP